ncbi:MAG: hypothetical protein J0L58_03435 [Burkholderiales bacterium]|nr:hypothetical protein [Burkholderiales bacterium]
MTDRFATTLERSLPQLPTLSSALESMALPSLVERRQPTEIQEEWLPFTVERVADTDDLHEAVRVRQQAYARHLPEFSETLTEPEPADSQPGVVVLLARSKLDGSPLGSMRIQTNTYSPLPLEASLDLPPELANASLAEATRLGVAVGQAGSLVKTALFKAFYLHCIAHNVQYMVVAGRQPLDRQYLRLLFREVYPERGLIPLRHAGNLPHRVMSLDLDDAERLWSEAKHPLLGFICHTLHPDIRIKQRPPRRRGLRLVQS